MFLGLFCILFMPLYQRVCINLELLGAIVLSYSHPSRETILCLQFKCFRRQTVSPPLDQLKLALIIQSILRAISKSNQETHELTKIVI